MDISEQKTIIVGGGIMGACTAWSLVKQGMGHVTLIDSHELPRMFGGASIDGGRGIRYAYGNEKGYMIMVSDAYETWTELFKDLGETLYTETGQIVIQNVSTTKSQLPIFQATIDSYNSMCEYKDLLGIDIQYLSKADVATMFPRLSQDDIDFGIYTTKSGVLHAGDIVSKTISWLRKQSNVTIYEGSDYEVVKLNIKNEVHERMGTFDINAKPQHTCILKSGQILSADHLVLATNNFTGDLIPEIKEQLIPTRQEVTFFEVPENELDYWKSLPLVYEDYIDKRFYFLPYQGGSGTYGVKASEMTYSTHSDIHNEDYKAKEGFNQEAINWFNRRFTPKGHEPLKPNYIKVCYYDTFPEERFQMHALDTNGSALALYGFSGHGFKFGSIVGKATASVITGQKSLKETKYWLSGQTTSKFSQIK